MKQKRIAILSLLSLGLVGASASVTPPVTLHAIYHSGEIHSYEIATAVYGVAESNRAVGIQFNMRMKVLRVNSGKATIQVVSSPPQSGKTVLPTRFKTVVVVLDRLNRPVGSSTSGQIFTAFPNHAIKVGDGWNGTSNLTLGSTSGAMVATAYKLNAIKSFKGRQIAEVTMKFGGLAVGEGTELIDTADGSLLSSDLKLRLNQSKKVPVEIILKRMY